MKTKNIFKVLIFGFVLLLTCVHIADAQETIKPQTDINPISVVYLTGIGCSNCAVVDPILFTETTAAYPDLLIFEYEIFKSKKENNGVKDAYFSNYIKNGSVGVPFIIFNQTNNYIGRIKVLNNLSKIPDIEPNHFPNPNGKLIFFNELDLTKLPGKVNIWTKNRVLISGSGGNNFVLKSLLTNIDITNALSSISFKKVKPISIEISKANIEFQHAVAIDGWRLQWNGDDVIIQTNDNSSKMYLQLMIVALIILAISMSFLRVTKSKKGRSLKFELKGKKRDIIITLISLLAIFAFFMFAKNISPDFLETVGYNLPLPLFTFLIAIVDGFNPCNMFVLTCLMALMIATSDSKSRLYIVASSFIIMVYIFYYMFMAAWLNVFKYITFITPLRISIALLALIAGFINCKELLFFKMGISLTIPEKQRGPLMKRMESMKEIIRNGSIPILVSSSLGLAALASLIELPCTAGFPIIYTGILAGKVLNSTFSYYAYLALYNLFYVLPLIVIVAILIFTLRSRQITQRQMEIIKFIGGVIMLLLGVLLLVNPELLGIGLS